MDKIDLHTHSTYSDGSFTPTELMELAAREHVRAVALTDHDSTLGLAEAESAALKYEVEFIPGIEISVNYLDKEIHILGLMINYKSSSLSDFLPSIIKARDERNLEMLERLNKAGANISMEDMNENNENRVITRAHFAHALVKTGFCKNKNEAFRKYLSKDCKTYVPREFMPAETGIGQIKKSGGISIIAHPTLYNLNYSEIEQMVKYMSNCGLEGLECYYSLFTAYEHGYMLKLAKKYRLCVSGGSDFHGINKPHIALGIGRGNLFIPYSVLEALKNRLK